ncbi:MAG: hypothetical protein JNN20_04560 [Betaproteobacteria bacterium]|nr:hypothetical protein [Betaproteobacteria bacterium]
MTQRTKFLFLIAIFTLPTIASFVVFYFFPPDRSSNYGELVRPIVTLPALPLSRMDGRADVIADGLRGKWLIVTRDSGLCEDVCRKKLYAMRQARQILGREQDRLIRVVLVDDNVVPSEKLQAEFEGTLWLSAKALTWTSLMPNDKGDSSGRASIFAVDTLGNVFMRYSSDPDIKRMSNDLKRVLKASQIG